MASMFDSAKQVYGELGVDVEAAFKRLDQIAVSLHCWQGDDVAGFENSGALDGGIQVTGNYPGRARNAEELRSDIDEVLSLIPGKKRLNLHALYAEPGKEKVSRDEIRPEHFANWIAWAKKNNVSLDFNPSFFSHPMMKDGFTLSSPDAEVRKFWIRHGIACRKIAEAFGRELGDTCITNFWVPDGYKDIPFDRLAPRERLRDSLDEIFAVEIDQNCNRDAVESKLFGIGAESCTVGSHEFYMGYAARNKKLLCLDAGHFHPTEVISDKLTSCLMFVDEVLLHVSRGVRWDSDHVVIMNEELKAIAEEVIRHDYDKRVHIGLDYFDASINRIMAWTIGARNMSKALLMALVEPAAQLRDAENSGDFSTRLALMEEIKTLPFAPIWNEYCERHNVPVGTAWIKEVKRYEKSVLAKRA